MKYEIELGSRFKKAFKQLRKKYHSLDKDLESLITELEQNPTTGSDLGNGVHKVRMAISDKGKGKSHGARIITYTAVISVEEGVITLLTIYDKADQSTITEKEISSLVDELQNDNKQY
ncbi:type II toxin-antitoxin system RelE/ParE family toxin [Phocaeicola sp.]